MRKGADTVAAPPPAPAGPVGGARPPAPAGAFPERVAGVPLEDLTAEQRALFWSVVADQFDPCGKPRSFGETLQAGEQDACPAAWTLARFVVRRVKDGADRNAIVLALMERLRREHDRATFATEGRPRTGPAAAAVTVVEFYDYECPYCRELEPRLEALRKRYPDVAFVLKQCPIEGHAASEPAARAAVAAARQGRFWELHRALFARGAALDEAAIEAAARDAGLDLDRFRHDVAAEDVARVVREDLEDADRAEVPGTPTFFVDGVYVTFDELDEQIRDAVARKREH